jgi:hypothetical protein
MLSQEIDFEIDIDKSIIGGYKVIVGERLYDLSIESYLDRIKATAQDKTGPQFDQYIESMDLDSESMESLKAQKELLDEFKNQVDTFNEKFDVSHIGIVESTGDGVVNVRGLSNCKYGELLKFENDIYGIVLNLELERIGAVLVEFLEKLGAVLRGRGTGRAGREIVFIGLGDAAGEDGQVGHVRREPDQRARFLVRFELEIFFGDDRQVLARVRELNVHLGNEQFGEVHGRILWWNKMRWLNITPGTPIAKGKGPKCRARRGLPVSPRPARSRLPAAARGMLPRARTD